MKSLEGKIAVITGGNSGIGKATAKLFAQEGAQVIIPGRRPDVVDAAAKEIGNGAIGVCGDVAILEFHQRFAEDVNKWFGGLDIYVANAGVINLEASKNVSEAEYDNHFAVNTRGVFFGVQAIAPLIRDGATSLSPVHWRRPNFCRITPCMQVRRRRWPHSRGTG
ncbi:NAD(P)-dependent dehydrogenase (short-subunit alcohol dehydrogenase family) [Rhizobium leguminosarum]|nr:NAD(P)-dependent dehydrogenase (short-subunit alcohol dehydrogenase family) [Rhizobium leguminosarum]MBB6297542.1 NAD(P)-dependent dehydrogenase (short-subunit alcohol dehydrogenase family) [Rhizobium leguminosarum]